MKPFQIPLFDTPFHRLPQEDADKFSRRTGWLDDTGAFDLDLGIIQSKPVPWWQGCELITAQSPDWGDVMGAWILNHETNRLVRLDGTSPPIHSLNAQMGLELNKDMVLPYLGFFCTFVHGEEGMFGLVGSDDDTILPSDWPRKKYAKHLKPAKVVAEEEGGFRVETTVFYSNALFWAHFLVKQGGMCEMLEDEPFVGDMEVTIGTRFKFESLNEPAEDAEDTDEERQVH